MVSPMPVYSSMHSSLLSPIGLHLFKDRELMKTSSYVKARRRTGAWIYG
uniref:Uncharacterized protein n=1 Tax=Arundo donax TaxID=35708 RepID=A0A0A9A8G4_ARUDO